MEMHQLRYFVAVAEDLNATRAAARIHVTQQAISKAVGALERELGVTLLVRRPRGCSRRIARVEPDRRAPALRVLDYCSDGWAEPALEAYRAAFPDRPLAVVRSESVEEFVAPLLSGAVDAVLTEGRLDADADVTVHHVAWRPRAALVPRRSEFAAAPELLVEDLLDACFGPRHPLEPRHWEGDWNLVPDRGEQPRRAPFDLPDDHEEQIAAIADAGCVVTQTADRVAEWARWSGGRMVAVPMPSARPVELTLTTASRTTAVDDLRLVLAGGA
jgi:DNA-binding transcriptional LysR family regulator